MTKKVKKIILGILVVGTLVGPIAPGSYFFGKCVGQFMDNKKMMVVDC